MSDAKGESLNIEKKSIHTEEEMPWIRYLIIDEYTRERKLKENTPEEIKSKYNEFIQKQIDNAVSLIINRIKELPSGTETSIIELLGNLDYRYNKKQLMQIKTEVLEKCEEDGISLNTEKYKDRDIGLPYVIPFIKG